VPPELRSLGSRVRFLRERANLTVRGLAERAEMAPGQISYIENSRRGERVAGIEAATILKLARALGCPVGWLIAEEGDPGPIPVFREAGDRRRKTERG
jgi:transcriptional regulator with XRE-family HTH domain